MANSDSDIYLHVARCAPDWLSTLKTVANVVDNRQSSLPDLSTPELSAQLGTTLDTYDSLHPGQLDTPFDDSRLCSTSTIQAQKSSAHTSIPLSHVRPQRPEKKVNGSIFYDGDLQNKLCILVDAISAAKGMARKNQIPPSQQMAPLKRALDKAADFCESAAFQLLRDGGVPSHLVLAEERVQTAYSICCTETANTTKLATPVLTTVAAPHIRSSLQPLKAPEVSVAGIVADDDDDELALSNIRFTSRMRRY